MIDATFINKEDSVPFRRMYKNMKTFLAAKKRMQGSAVLDYALDLANFKIIR